MKINNHLLAEFVDYMNSFYGVGGVYAEHNITKDEVLVGLGIHLERKGKEFFEGDSTDRELVRDIILDELRGA